MNDLLKDFLVGLLFIAVLSACIFLFFWAMAHWGVYILSTLGSIYVLALVFVLVARFGQEIRGGGE
jgi:hypothetical protein